MKKIGILGGMSWESTSLYYRWLNEGVKERLGGLHSARIVLCSLDFAEVATLQKQEAWAKAGDILAAEASALESAGADMVILATNTMHIVADKISAAIKIPFIHLADATADQIVAAEIKTVGLLGTKFTMEKDFYKGRIESRGIKVIVPDESDRQLVHDVIYNELCKGQINPASKVAFQKIINNMAATQGAQGIILGCTEITMLIGAQDTTIPQFDTTRIHVQKALDLALA